MYYYVRMAIFRKNKTEIISTRSVYDIHYYLIYLKRMFEHTVPVEIKYLEKLSIQADSTGALTIS